MDSSLLGAGTSLPEAGSGGAFGLLSDITESLNLGNSVEEVFNLVYDRLRDFIPYSRIAIALVDEKSGRLGITAARSDGKLVLGKGYSAVLAGSSLEPLLKTGKVRIINDLQDYLEKKPTSESTRLIVREGMRSSLTVPLVVRGSPVGVMFFSSRESHAYGPQHAKLLRSIAGHMAVAIERSKLIEALREKTDYLENVLENTFDAVAVVDPQNRILTWNEGARRIFGYAARDVLGRDFSLLVPPEDVASGEEVRMRERLNKDGFVREHECVRLAKDGKRVTVSATSSVLRDKLGRIMAYSSVIRDVTHVKKLQQDLLNSQSLAAVGELAATVAHEIKNPLAGISGAIQVLREAIPPEGGRREIVAEILDQIRRLDNTVRDLLSFSRPAVPSFQDLALADSVAKAWSLLRGQPGTARVSFKVEGASGTRLRGDPQLLHQVWLNLFQNAIEAMPKGGELTVRAGDGNPVLIEVHDTGPGIEPANLIRLFRPFFSTKTRGTGLGLAISRKIVEAHGGSIRAESRPNQGTSLIVEIPK